jgi:hypothetical protein
MRLAVHLPERARPGAPQCVFRTQLCAGLLIPEVEADEVVDQRRVHREELARNVDHRRRSRVSYPSHDTSAANAANAANARAYPLPADEPMDR